MLVQIPVRTEKDAPEAVYLVTYRGQVIGSTARIAELMARLEGIQAREGLDFGAIGWQ